VVSIVSNDEESFNDDIYVSLRLVYFLHIPSLPGSIYIRIFSGAQPITNLSGDVALSVNGEIYNHIELRLDLDCMLRVKTKLIYIKISEIGVKTKLIYLKISKFLFVQKSNAKVLLVGIVRGN
jgi:hypothetical protein